MNKQFAKNLISLSRTQSRIAKEKAKWAAEGGRDSAKWAAEARRLTRESIKYREMAEREMTR